MASSRLLNLARGFPSFPIGVAVASGSPLSASCTTPLAARLSTEAGSGAATVAWALEKHDRPVVLTEPSTTMQEVAAKLRAAKVGCLLLADGAKADRVKGLLTDKDFVKAVENAQFGTSAAASNIMTPIERVKWVTKETPLQKCVSLMRDNRVRHVPVFDKPPASGGVLQGLISSHDILSATLEGHVCPRCWELENALEENQQGYSE